MRRTRTPVARRRAQVARVTQQEYEALAAFRYALRRFLHFSEQAAVAAGVTPQQHQALLAIVGYPGGARISVGELAERLQIAHHSAVGLVDRLVAHQLLVRQSGASDARTVFLKVTARGRKVLEQLTAAHREEITRLGTAMQIPEFLYEHGESAPSA